MTLWSPVFRVKVDGVTTTSSTLSGLTITSGRTDIYSQPIAGYCNLTLLETNVSQVSYDINDAVTIEVQDTAGNWVSLFGGFITDLSITVQTSGSTALSQRIQITAVGALARIARTIYTGNINSAFDGTQIYDLLATALFDQWNEVPASQTWAAYDPTVQWLNAENSGIGEVDTPGDYELIAQNNVNGTVYALCSDLANSALGYLYEDASGRIGYADSTHRNEYLATYGYVDLDGNQAIGPNMSITKKAGDVRNSITVGYGGTGASVTSQDLTSISLYGQLANTIDTKLKHVADATAQAAYYLQIRAYPQYAFKQITYPLASSEIDDADRNSLLNVFMGLPLNITGLPANMGNGEFQGFVEGWTWSASLGQLNLTMNLSPVAYSLQTFRWTSVPATESWNTINPSLQWLNATIVA